MPLIDLAIGHATGIPFHGARTVLPKNETRIRRRCFHSSARSETVTTPLISVCIPTYRRPDLLREAVESVVRQEYRPLEIIVGDDSPTPAAENVVAAAL
ncbi:MAG: glycosyltransferase, partial [Planctomycetota bacterium]